MNGAADDPDKAFTNLLDAELEKVTSFYQLKEAEIYGELDALINDEAHYEREQEDLDQEQQTLGPGKQTRSTSIFKAIGFNRPRATSTVSGRSTGDGEADDDEDSDMDANETSRLRQKSPDGQRRRRRTTDENMTSDGLSSKRRTSVAFDDYNDMAFSALYDEGVSLKKRTVSVYVSLCELRSFIQLNKTGFEKVLKKFDKILDRKLKSQYLNKYVYPAYPFLQSTMDRLTQKLEHVEQAYSQLVAEGWLTGRHGSGTFAASPGLPRSSSPAPTRRLPAPAPVLLDAGTPYIDPLHAAGWRRAWREVSTATPPRGSSAGPRRSRMGNSISLGWIV